MSVVARERCTAGSAPYLETLPQVAGAWKDGCRCDTRCRATLGEIRAWGQATLDIGHVPAVWRAFAHQPRLLETTWRKDRLIMGEGVLDALVKNCVALAVAQFRQSSYWIGYFTHVLRKGCRLDDRVIVEVAGAVMHYVSFNTVAHAMRLAAPVANITAADVVPGGPLEHIIPPGARKRSV